jgi:peptidoglycan/LPS O-acetylase OafA/YrhL
MVLFSHLHFSHLPGGYIGVDIFFALSGYVITLSFIGDTPLETVSSSNLQIVRTFYLKRAFRILPLLGVILCVVYTASRIFLSQKFYSLTISDIKWSALFFQNVHLIRESSNYFDSNVSNSILQHLWSLSIEEQFYFLFPLAIFIILSLSSAIPFFAKKNQKFWLLIFFSFLTLTSFIYSAYQSFKGNDFIYFSSQVRFWELGVGVCLALIGPNTESRLRLQSTLLLRIASYAGLLAISIVFQPDTSYPGWIGILPLACTGILLGNRPKGSFDNPSLNLVGKIFSYIGKISFSIYMWHWPVIVLFELMIPKLGSTFLGFVFELLLIFGISIFSYHVIEILPKTYLTRKFLLTQVSREKERKGFKYLKFLKTIFNVNLEIILSILLIGILVLGYLAKDGVIRSNSTKISLNNNHSAILNSSQLDQGFESKSVISTPNKEKIQNTQSPLPASNTFALSTYKSMLTAWQNKVQQMENLSQVPREIKSIVQREMAEKLWPRADCVQSFKENSCSFGSGPRKIMIVGDSHAVMYRNMIWPSFDPIKYTVVGRFAPYCKFGDVQTLNANNIPILNCNEWLATTLAQVKKNRPSLLIISELDQTNIRFNNQVLSGTEEILVVQKALAASISKVSPYVGNILFLGQTPTASNLAYCSDKEGKFINPCYSDPNQIKDFVAAEKSISSISKFHFLNLEDWLCTSDQCPPIIDGNLTNIDGNHLTNEMASKLAPLFASYLIDQRLS